MSIIQRIREKYAAAVIGVIALSLIGFILMDAGRGNRNRGGGLSEETIAEVNGKKISLGEYNEMVKMMEEAYAAQGRPIPEEMKQQVYEQVWSQLTDGAVLDNEMDKIGLTLTDKEISDEMFVSNPPEFLKAEFTDKQTGEFNGAAARQALNQLKKKKNDPQNEILEKMYIDPYIQSLLRKKYFALLQSSVYVPKWMAEKQLADNNAISSFQFVQIPYSTISDSSIKITDEQINNYVKEHKSLFKQDEPTRGIAYVSFDLKPTASDSAATLKAITDLKPAFESAKEPGSFVTRNSSAIEYHDGYTSKSKITSTNKDSLLAAGVGKVYGPYLENGSWIMSRIVDIKEMPDSVKARHILVGTVDPASRQPKLDDASAKKKIDSIYNLVKGGADFAALATQLSDDEGSKVKGGDLGYFAQGAMVPEFNDSCFLGKVGDYKIVHSQFGYHLINIQDQKGIEPAYKIAYMSKAIYPSQETTNDVINKSNLFAGNSRDMKAFEENIKKSNYQKFLANNIKGSDFTIPSIGTNRQLVRWIYEHKVGDISEPINLSDKYVVVALTDIEEEGLPSAAKVRPQVEMLLRNKEKAKQIKTKIGTVTALETLASAQGQTVQRADSVGFNNPTLSGAGYEPNVVGASFNKANLNKVSQPINGNGGVFVIKTESISAKSDAAANIEELREQMAKQQKGGVSNVINGLRDAAKIKDNRSKLL